jgi:Eukaryotic-type carbonic anhydrase
LLPNTDQYMTYEGSTTHPGCWESTVWIILNKPIYITKQEVSSTGAFMSCFNERNEFLPAAVRIETADAGLGTDAKGAAGQQRSAAPAIASPDDQNEHRL